MVARKVLDLGFAAAAAGFSFAIVTAYARQLRDEAVQKRHELERFKRLKTQPSYWRTVGVTRMGLYVTRIESQFITKALGGKQPSVTIDVGAGNGRLEPALIACSKNVIATEVTRSELEAMERAPSLGLVHVGRFPSLPFAAGSVDAIVAIEVPAVAEQEWFRFECARVLRPGGSVICSLYNKTSYKAFTRRGSSVNGYYQVSLREQKHRWMAAGFESKDSQGFYWIPLSRESDNVLLPLFSLLEAPLRTRPLNLLSPWGMEHFVKT